jgi:hypothetical protein
VEFGSLVVCILVALGPSAPGVTLAKCGEECDAILSSNIDDCRFQYGDDDPADGDDLTKCIQAAGADYRNCVEDCTSAGISLPHRLGLMPKGAPVSVRSACRGPVRYWHSGRFGC